MHGKPLVKDPNHLKRYDMTFENEIQKANIKILDIKNTELIFPVHYSWYMDTWFVSFPNSYHKKTVREIEYLLNKNKIHLNTIRDHKCFRYQRFHDLTLKCKDIKINCRPYTLPRILSNAGYNYVQIQNYGFYELGTDPYCFHTQMLECDVYLKLIPTFRVPDFNIMILCTLDLNHKSINSSKYDFDLNGSLKLPNSVYMGF
jgi:hypothetical protein